jgi:hypothetical protein
VRQLAWCIGGSPILEKGAGIDWITGRACREWLEEYWPQLLILDDNPAPLEDALHAAGPLLGKRFEALMKWYFESSDQWNLLLSNEVVEVNGRTIGEVDFILEDRNGVVVHLEVACKFYLGEAGSQGEWGRWRGLRAEDSLEKKVAKFSRQLDLHRSDWPKVQRKAACLKGWLFYPFRELAKPKPPRGAAPRAPSGWWMHTNEIQSWTECPNLWAVPRREWLMQVHESQIHGILPFERGGLVAQTWVDNDQVKETSRGMIAPDFWPH